jgi:hypothetical protein
MRSSMLQPKARGWFSGSGIPGMSWWRDIMILHKNSNLWRPHLL